MGTIGLSVVTDLGEDGGGEAKERGFVWEERGDPRPSLDLVVEPLQAVDRSEPSRVGGAGIRRTVGTEVAGS